MKEKGDGVKYVVLVDMPGIFASPAKTARSVLGKDIGNWKSLFPEDPKDPGMIPPWLQAEGNGANYAGSIVIRNLYLCF